MVDSSSVSGSAGGFTDSLICVGYRHQFDIINERNGETQKLFTVPDGCSKAHLIAAMDLYEDEEPELLLCYNSA